MMTIAFVALATAGVGFAYFLKSQFSGGQLTLLKFYACFCYNAIFGIFYVGVIKRDCFWFYGCVPELRMEHPYIRWVAFLCVFLHAFSNPMKIAKK